MGDRLKVTHRLPAPRAMACRDPSFRVLQDSDRIMDSPRNLIHIAARHFTISNPFGQMTRTPTGRDREGTQYL
jgi:hypothetical protein